MSPQQQVDVLKGKVDDLLEAEVLNNGQANGLKSKLDLNGIVNQDAGIVAAFINQVNALLNAGKLIQEEADLLLDCAELLLKSITTS